MEPILEGLFRRKAVQAVTRAASDIHKSAAQHGDIKRHMGQLVVHLKSHGGDVAKAKKALSTKPAVHRAALGLKKWSHSAHPSHELHKHQHMAAARSLISSYDTVASLVEAARTWLAAQRS